MDIVRFGVGHRRPEGPAGSRNVSGQVLFSDPRGVISELAFGRNGAIEPHSNPNTTWFVVIEGGGFVRVGDEQSRVGAGEAVLWPPGILHAAWTDHAHMRAIVVEFEADDPVLRGIVEGRGLAPAAPEPVAPADGRLTKGSHPGYSQREGEPF